MATLIDRFSGHDLDNDQIVLCAAVRITAFELAEYINENVPDSREKSVALTKLEEVVFWANAGIARN
jgi:antitoxin component of MazEF toxin-antitoxin module